MLIVGQWLIASVRHSSCWQTTHNQHYALTHQTDLPDTDEQTYKANVVNKRKDFRTLSSSVLNVKRQDIQENKDS